MGDGKRKRWGGGETEKQIQSRIVFDQAAISPRDRATARDRTAHDLDLYWGSFSDNE